MFEEKEIGEVMHRQENALEEDSVNNQAEEKDSHIFQPPTNLFHYLPLEELMQKFVEETSHEQSKVQEIRGMETFISISSTFVKDADLKNVGGVFYSVFIFPPMHISCIDEMCFTLAMLLNCVQNILPFYQELIQKCLYFFHPVNGHI